MDVVVKGEKVVAGDCVLLSCSDSASIWQVSDVDGCQIRLDGKAISVEGEWCKVLVKVEELGRPMAMLMKTRDSCVELTERVHVWSKLRAKGIDRIRQTGSDECEFWAPLGETSSTHAKQMKIPASIIISLAVVGISLITPLPLKASTVECSELAKRFSNGDVDFDEKLKCKAGKSEMTYGKYCPRTQGIVCSEGRGWD